MNRRIAYVEDQDAVRRKYTRAMRDAGFEVRTYTSRQEARTALLQTLPDLALLDVTDALDRDAGYRLCSEIRRISGVTPVVFLACRPREVDKIPAYRLGADDYISKDASSDYLVTRIETLLARVDAIRDSHYPPAGPSPAVNTGLEMDEKLATVNWKGNAIDLPLAQFCMLRELNQNPGAVRNHGDLMRAAGLMVEPNTIAAHVKSIRRAFLQQDPDFHCIRTEWGRGYRWIEE